MDLQSGSTNAASMGSPESWMLAYIKPRQWPNRQRIILHTPLQIGKVTFTQEKLFYIVETLAYRLVSLDVKFNTTLCWQSNIIWTNSVTSNIALPCWYFLFRNVGNVPILHYCLLDFNPLTGKFRAVSNVIFWLLELLLKFLNEVSNICPPF